MPSQSPPKHLEILAPLFYTASVSGSSTGSTFTYFQIEPIYFRPSSTILSLTTALSKWDPGRLKPHLTNRDKRWPPYLLDLRLLPGFASHFSHSTHQFLTGCFSYFLYCLLSVFLVKSSKKVIVSVLLYPRNTTCYILDA